MASTAVAAASLPLIVNAAVPPNDDSLGSACEHACSTAALAARTPPTSVISQVSRLIRTPDRAFESTLVLDAFAACFPLSFTISCVDRRTLFMRAAGPERLSILTSAGQKVVRAADRS